MFFCKSFGGWRAIAVASSFVLMGVAAMEATGCQTASSDGVKPCVGQNLAALCSPGWNPVLNSAAKGDCNGSANYNGDNGSGSGTYSCASDGKCSIQCVRADACPCGIASVSRTELVCRTDCPTGCPDGTCESNETADSCPGDCAPAAGTSAGVDGGSSIGSSPTGTPGSSTPGAGDPGSENIPNAVVSSEDFETSVPPGSWQVDSTRYHTGSSSAHAKPLTGPGTTSMELECDGSGVTPTAQSHSEMSFWYLGDPATGQTLNFYVDDALYQTYGSTYSSWGAGGYNWTNVILVVPNGTHTYKWEEVATNGGAPGFFVDTVSCTSTPATANKTTTWDFEGGFVPPEITGTFEIDNSRAQAGTFGAHPGLADANGATMAFSCGGKSHSSISFYYMGYPTEGESLDFYVDDMLYQSYGSTYSSWGAGGYNWTNESIKVSSGTHSYRWVETGPDGGVSTPSYSIDTISCK